MPADAMLLQRFDHSCSLVSILADDNNRRDTGIICLAWFVSRCTYLRTPNRCPWPTLDRTITDWCHAWRVSRCTYLRAANRRPVVIVSVLSLLAVTRAHAIARSKVVRTISRHCALVVYCLDEKESARGRHASCHRIIVSVGGRAHAGAALNSFHD